MKRMSLNFNVFRIALPVLLFCLVGCSSYKAKKQEAQLIFPELGSLVKPKGDLFYRAAEQVGTPNWGTLKVTAQKLPFNNDSYHEYAKGVQQAGKINTIAFNDSLKYSPKYVRLQLLDKVKMVELLNNSNNKGILAYLEHDEDIKLITSIDIAPTEADIELLTKSAILLLERNESNGTILRVISEKKEVQYQIEELGVFNYEYASFCWGEDKYYNPKISQITIGGESCPKETVTRPSKLKKRRDNLKF